VLRVLEVGGHPEQLVDDRRVEEEEGDHTRQHKGDEREAEGRRVPVVAHECARVHESLRVWAAVGRVGAFDGGSLRFMRDERRVRREGRRSDKGEWGRGTTHTMAS
jgi:hypothetical protein